MTMLLPAGDISPAAALWLREHGATIERHPGKVALIWLPDERIVLERLGKTNTFKVVDLDPPFADRDSALVGVWNINALHTRIDVQTTRCTPTSTLLEQIAQLTDYTLDTTWAGLQAVMRFYSAIAPEEIAQALLVYLDAKDTSAAMVLQFHEQARLFQREHPALGKSSLQFLRDLPEVTGAFPDIHVEDLYVYGLRYKLSGTWPEPLLQSTVFLECIPGLDDFRSFVVTQPSLTDEVVERHDCVLLHRPSAFTQAV